MLLLSLALKKFNNDVKKRVIKWIAALDTLIITGCVACFKFIPRQENIEIFPLVEIIIMFVLIVIVNLLVGMCMAIDFQNNIEAKKSMEEVNKRMEGKDGVQVIPIKADAYENFILLVLPEKVRFFAEIYDEENVIVQVEFLGDEEWKVFELIPKKVFTKFYKFVEN